MVLRGDPTERDVARAREFISRGARQKHNEAILLEIAPTAIGSGVPMNWPAALSLLRDPAKHIPWLRDELRIVERLQLNSDGYPVKAPQGTLIDDQINLIRFEGFLSPEEYQHIANVSVRMLEPSTVFDPRTGRKIQDSVRSSEGAVIGPALGDLAVQAINRRIAAVTQTRLEQGEPISVLRYNPGQKYKLHYDAIRGAANNRIKTIIMYLNEGYVGGRTNFPDLNVLIEPRAGDAIVFDNIGASGSMLFASRHAGLPLAQGTKWIATRWIRKDAFDPWSYSPDIP